VRRRSSTRSKRVGDLEVGERPQAEHPVGHERGVADAQQCLRQRAREHDGDERRDRGGDQDERRRAARQAGAALAVAVVESRSG
jgi:hypothetical protein